MPKKFWPNQPQKSWNFFRTIQTPTVKLFRNNAQKNQSKQGHWLFNFLLPHNVLSVCFLERRGGVQQNWEQFSKLGYKLNNIYKLTHATTPATAFSLAFPLMSPNWGKKKVYAQHYMIAAGQNAPEMKSPSLVSKKVGRLDNHARSIRI